MANPVLSKRTAAIRKSNSVQLTSSMNCMAIKGISNKNATIDTIIVSLLYINEMFYRPPAMLNVKIVKKLSFLYACKGLAFIISLPEVYQQKV